MGATMNFDDEFAKIVDGVELEEPKMQDFSDWSNFALLKERHRVTEELKNRGALVHPTETEDKDLQGYYYEILTELQKRGIA